MEEEGSSLLLGGAPHSHLKSNELARRKNCSLEKLYFLLQYKYINLFVKEGRRGWGRKVSMRSSNEICRFDQ